MQRDEVCICMTRREWVYVLLMAHADLISDPNTSTISTKTISNEL